MDKISEILNNIKDRFSNPLIFSFVCAWLVFNWEITVALLWYDTKEIRAEGCQSIFEFIRDYLRRKDTLTYPILFALIYTFLFPIIKNIVSAFNTWTIKWGENWDLLISKGANVPYEKYLKLRESYFNKMEVLEDIISSENKYIEENGKLNDRVIELSQINVEIKNKILDLENDAESVFNVTFLNGYWKYILSFAPDSEKEPKSLDIKIDNGAYYEIKDSIPILKYSVKHFHYIKSKQTIFFIKNPKPDSFSDDFDLLINVLRCDNENLLSGNENHFGSVQYKRITPLDFPKNH